MGRKTLSWISHGIKTFVLRKKTPYLFGMVITDRCNLNCFYCESKNAGTIHFSFQQARDTLLKAYERGHRSLYFTGGEPMLWQDNDHHLKEVLNFARELGFFDIFIFTNGTIPLTIEGCSYIVTIDGPKHVHDRIRDNTYDVIMENVANAVTDAVFASITFNRANVQYLEPFVKAVTATGLFKSISFNLLTHWPEMVAQYGLSGEQRKELLERIWHMKKMGFPIVLSRAAYKALQNNNWKRPIPQIELGTSDRIYQCCRDVEHPQVCENCGYANCVEVSQILAFKPSAMWQVIRMVGLR